MVSVGDRRDAWTGLSGPGRYDPGIHIESDIARNLILHDDTVSPWINGSIFFQRLHRGLRAGEHAWHVLPPPAKADISLVNSTGHLLCERHPPRWQLTASE